MGWRDYYNLLVKYDGLLSRATELELEGVRKRNPNDPESAQRLAFQKWREDRERLADAAPALLEVCEAIHEWLGTESAAQALPLEPPWYQQLRDAIAKAKGEG